MTYKPFYQDEYSTIYHGDNVEIIKQLEKVDLILTDPPYGLGESKGKNKTRGKIAIAKDYGDQDWDNTTASQEFMDFLVTLGKYSIIFGGNYYKFEPSSCWLVWDKNNGENDFADCELAWTNLDKAVRRIKHTWNGMLQEKMGAEKEERWHPTQKPLSVMKWCILQAPIETKTILDPFMGSGTTLRAAKDLGIHCIGIEKEEKYCEIAAKRMSQEILKFNEF